MKLLARLTTGKPWSVVAAALLFTAIAGAFGGPVAGILQGGGFFDPHSAGKAASDKVQGATGALASPVIILVRLTAPIASPEAHEQVLAAESSLSADPNIQSIGGYYDTGSPTFLSTDGTQTFLAVNLKPATPDAGIEAEHIAALLKSQPNTKVGGAAMAQQQVQEQVKKDLGMAESLAFPLLFLLSLWVFRGLIAATLPLMGGGITILGAFLGLRLVTLHTPLSIFALNLTTGMGLGLAIDYSLFILSRFREEMKAGLTVDKAVSRSLATAGRTVLFSSLTVAVALSSLLVFPEPFLYSMAVGGIITSLMAAASALVLLPAVLRLLGRRVNSLAPTRWHREMEEAEGFWYRLARIVLRRPVFSALAAGGVLILLGLPFLSMKFTSVDTSVLPASYSSRQVNDVLTQDFPATATPAMYAVFTSPSGDPGAVQAFAQRLAGLPEVKAVSLQPLDVQTWRIGITVRHGIYSSQAWNLVGQIRNLDGQHYLVGGVTADFADLQSSLAKGLPLAIVIVAGGAILLLFFMTGSVVLPLKAVLMNLLSLSAAFGLLVVIFQQGHLQSILRFESQGALESTQPILLFALVFGLSTDYGVFLLARIKEARDSGHTNKDAVAIGVGRTGRIVSAAALLFCVAIGAFATSQIVFIKELGVGTALGVIIDATIVRGILVPSLMALLGEWNWWAPRPLRHLYRHAGLHEESSTPLATIPLP